MEQRRRLWLKLCSLNLLEEWRAAMEKKDLENRFTYHPPKEGQPERYVTLRAAAYELASVIEALCPDSREKSLAMTKLEEAVMWANASIARNE